MEERKNGGKRRKGANKTDRQTDRKTDRQTDRQTGKQTDRQTVRQTEIETVRGKQTYRQIESNYEGKDGGARSRRK